MLNVTHRQIRSIDHTPIADLYCSLEMSLARFEVDFDLINNLENSALYLGIQLSYMAAQGQLECYHNHNCGRLS